MNPNKHVFVLVGQRASGKSTYARKLVERQPELQLISRDDILVKAFGKIDCDHYCGNLEWGEDEAWRLVKVALSADRDFMLILDHWTWTSLDRKKMIKTLRDLGATAVTALYFKTPAETVSQWFWLKPKIAKSSEMKRIGFDQGFTFYMEDAPIKDHTNFHRHAETIANDGFDSVLEIDPLSDLVTL